jgi:collagenase-like PrtC family protease
MLSVRKLIMNTSPKQSLKLSLAPIAFYWSKERTLQFYADAMHWPVDIIYLGEVVCSRRHLMKLDDWMELAKALREAGKEVVISTLTLIESEADRRAMHRLIDKACEQGITVEANDFSAVRALHAKQQSFVAGPHLNVYHDGTLAWLAGLGANRFVPPIEMGREDLLALQASRPANFETEIQVWGRMALAYSSRCFTARHHRLHKDSCDFRCEHYPDGLILATREHSDFLNINGIQTQSSTCLDLGEELPQLHEMGIDVLRIQPQNQHMENIVQEFDHARLSLSPAKLSPSFLPPNASPANGYWSGKSGMQWSDKKIVMMEKI